MQNLDLFASKFDLGDEPELSLTLSNIGKFLLTLSIPIEIRLEDRFILF